MIEIGMFLGLLVATALALIFVLLRRGNHPTEDVEGLLIEQRRRLQAHQDRTDYASLSTYTLLNGTSDRRLP
ncbi:hypothetical protein LUX12_03810 [Streptomyces somaliensis]|uniref:hypothetical protein n=1 Tax=Streptomyces somaliensis TaxID=78355 RepID=UPI0020CF399A|nr:hypothetical protein [Streptomyces somaliensis]MCP9944111.1 hypothetical protein [Streptomyces somaliensis]MCP9962655.1 hypothetical protein [Streptomyces somaliensis]MCP9975487.1 hypothetical protein [Streptomyces somaliensis]